MTKTVKLGEICEIIAGQSPPSETYNNTGGGLPFYQGKADFGLLYPKTRMWCSKPQKIALPDDILMSVRAPVGPTNICQEKSCIGRGLTAIRAGASVFSKYILHFLRSIEHELANKGNGSTFAAITQAEVRAIEIPLPPLPEQRRIAALLDQADALRQKDRQLLAHYDQLAQSIFLDLFGDPVRNEKGWKINNLSSCYSKTKEGTKCGPFGSALKKEDYVDKGVPVWIMDNIVVDKFRPEGSLFVSYSKYKSLQSYSATTGDIIISRAGTVGKMCVIDIPVTEAIISTNLIRLSLDDKKLLPIYFVSLMTYFKGKVGRLKTGNEDAFTHMNTGILNSLNIPVPPLALQTQFAEAIEQIERQKAVVREQMAASEALFGRLLQEYFG